MSFIKKKKVRYTTLLYIRCRVTNIILVNIILIQNNYYECVKFELDDISLYYTKNDSERKWSISLYYLLSSDVYLI